ncbi:hypothetical protein FA15DRAFT_621736 [Coprinopsis marcescibilis]|uniref:N-acetyltransferase domain-containing protein n=1 Tax=Coprinopsis marcescibilis TaxID=230819 RepID=A0A5C3KSV1_COPMA|nr:hypothetical protein FA15DRAFT_621736 [Coprinopsis marcescibilis]
MGTTTPSISDLEVRCKIIDAQQTISLRHSVLWPDKDISHVLLPDDQTGTHLGAFAFGLSRSEEPIAVISLFLEPLPIDNAAERYDYSGQKAVRFRKFACASPFQGRGIGTKLLEYTMSVAERTLGASVIWCDARVSSQKWYEKRGLSPFGSAFYKSNVKYIRMKCELLDDNASGAITDEHSAFRLVPPLSGE